MININSPLLTDLYQFTMAQGYYTLGMAEKPAVFHLFFRKNPFKGEFGVVSGLEQVIEFIENFKFSNEELAYLQHLKAPDGSLLFEKTFLSYLKDLKFTCHVDAIEEGNIVFANEPLIRVEGPLLQCQLIETPLINLINYSTLISTKAARVKEAAGKDPVMEFGLRRAQGPNGGLTASRAAYIGGCESTSNTLAGMVYDIPVKGTMAHSWVMSFENEEQAFEQYAKVMPHNSILLVDTFNTLEGVKKAIKVGLILVQQGYHFMGIRLDSGDLKILSQQARTLLDAAGFTKVKIVASGDLEENRIKSLKESDAKIDIWGVGTRLVTAYDQPSLDVAYKLSCIQDDHGQWQHKIKVSDQPEKITNPGIQQIKRFFREDKYLEDIIYDIHLGLQEPEPEGATNNALLLVPIFKNGQCVYNPPPLQQIQKKATLAVQDFRNSSKEPYIPKLDGQLQKEKMSMINSVEK